MGCTRGVMVKAMDCEFVVSEFELQSLYYVPFRTYNLGKGVVYIYIFIQRHNIKDRHMKENAWRIKMHEGRHKKTSLTKLHLPLTLLQGFEKLACERMLETEHKLHILTPLLWPSHCVFIVLLMLGSTPSGLSEGPLGRVWPSLPHLVSGCLEFDWQLHRRFSECPLGRVWPSLPHLVSTVRKSAGNCFGTPNSTELNNNSTPTRSPTGSLNRMFNRHQAEITVMQFRGYFLPLHDCNGRMGPSPFPIS